MIYINLHSHIFFILLLLAACLLILSRNPVHCIFYFIFCIFNVSGLILICHVEYLAVIFLLVYIGAIMVSSTFVVMMLNIKVIDISEYRVRYIPLAIIMCSSLLCEIYLMLPVPGPFIKLYSVSMPYTYINWIEQYVYVSNVEAIGLTFYNYYIVIFLLIGIILLMGMLSSISLVFIPSLRIKRQYSYQQMERKIIESIYIAS